MMGSSPHIGLGQSGAGQVMPGTGWGAARYGGASMLGQGQVAPASESGGQAVSSMLGALNAAYGTPTVAPVGPRQLSYGSVRNRQIADEIAKAQAAQAQAALLRRAGTSPDVQAAQDRYVAYTGDPTLRYFQFNEWYVPGPGEGGGDSGGPGGGDGGSGDGGGSF